MPYKTTENTQTKFPTFYLTDWSNQVCHELWCRYNYGHRCHYTSSNQMRHGIELFRIYHPLCIQEQTVQGLKYHSSPRQTDAHADSEVVGLIDRCKTNYFKLFEKNQLCF